MTEATSIEEVENMIQEEGLNAPRLSPDDLKKAIVSEEYVFHTVANGAFLTWCILVLENGYTVVGDPSVCVSIENNNEKVGKQVAYNNSFDKLWPLEGYKLKEKLYQENK